MNVLNHFQHSILNDSTADLYTYKTHSQIWIDIAMEDIELSFDIQISKSLTKCYRQVSGTDGSERLRRERAVVGSLNAGLGS